MTLAAGLLLLAPAAAGTASAHQAAPEIVAAVSSLAVAPDAGYVTRLGFDVTSIDPTLVTAGGPSTLTVSGTMTNTGQEALVDLSYRFQRGDALRSGAQVRDQLADPAEPVAQVPSTFTPLSSSLPGGASAPFTFTVAITMPAGLDITRPGVYPLMVNVNGGVSLPAGPLEARIGELYLLLTVMAVPGATTSPAPGGSTVPTGRATPMNFVWPLVDRPHLGVGDVFLDDDLLTAISPGGRLVTLLDGLTSAAARDLPSGLLTVVVDPQLLDELDRMTGPYRVVAPGEQQPAVTALPSGPAGAAPSTGPAPPSTEPATGPATEPVVPATPDAGTPTGTPAPASVDVPGTVAGTGQQAATSFLERLRGVAAEHPVVLLPYGDPDVVALVRAGMTAEVAATENHGREVGRRMLGASVTPDTAFPIDGAVDDATLAALIAAGDRTGLLSQASVEAPAGSDGRPVASAVIDAGSAPGLPSAIARTDVLGGLDRLIDDRRQSGWAMTVNSLTASLAQQQADGTTTPAVFAPVRRWSPDAADLVAFIGLLGELGRSGVISGESLATLTSTATQVASVEYPAQAQDRELPSGYLDRVATARASVAELRAALATVPQPTDPAALLDPLDQALDAAASTAFRTDPGVGESNLTTVESTVTQVRSGVQIASAGNSYTLASSTSPLVLTVQNSLPYDVPVTVELTGGEMVGLTVVNQPVQIIPAGRSQQVKIPTEVTRSGQFQVTATLAGPDGSTWGTPVQLSVESSAYGALTVILMVVAGGVLVIMVALRIRQRLRGRRARIAAAAARSRPDIADPADSITGDPGRSADRPEPSAGPSPPRMPAAPQPGPADRRLVPGVSQPAGGRTENRQGFRS